MTSSSTNKTASVILEREINEVNGKRILIYQKRLLDYKGKNIALTDKQIGILKFVAKGFSNAKIAQRLNKKEATIKLLIYRLMKYLEFTLNEKIDRFYLIIIAQQLGLNSSDV